MISERQEQILKIIVQEYTMTAQPVGSKKIMELMVHKVSSATIRNECAVLEKEGYLEKQHTSSGRVPSSKGYRYYVDNLMNGDFGTEIFKRIDELFNMRNKSVDEIITESTKMISDLTNLTAIISKKDDTTSLKVKKIELIPLSVNSASVIFILSNGEIIKKVYYLDEEGINDLKISIGLFNDNLVDTDIKDIQIKAGQIQEKLKGMVKDYDYLFQNFLNAIVEETKVKQSTYGLNNLLANPEFSDTEKLRKAFAIVENISPFDWFDYNYQNSKNNTLITTKIGEEIGIIEGSDDLAVISSEYSINDGQQTAITLIGPKRMRYDEASVLLQFLIDKINGLNNK